MAIFIDSNIPIYLVGGAHPLKDTTTRLLELLIRRGERLVTDAEVLQEILHRFAAIRRRDAIQTAFDVLLNVVDHVYPVERADMELACTLMLGHQSLSARDSVHVAVMRRYEIERIFTFDAGFDGVIGIERVLG